MKNWVKWGISIDLKRVRALDGGFGAIGTDLALFGRISALNVTPKQHVLGHPGEVKVDALPYTLSYGPEIWYGRWYGSQPLPH